MLLSKLGKRAAPLSRWSPQTIVEETFRHLLKLIIRNPGWGNFGSSDLVALRHRRRRSVSFCSGRCASDFFFRDRCKPVSRRKSFRFGSEAAAADRRKVFRWIEFWTRSADALFVSFWASLARCTWKVLTRGRSYEATTENALDLIIIMYREQLEALKLVRSIKHYEKTNYWLHSLELVHPIEKVCSCFTHSPEQPGPPINKLNFLDSKLTNRFVRLMNPPSLLFHWSCQCSSSRQILRSP